MIVSRIISGGQTGADRGGLDAAMELGLPHGGHCPKGRLAEDGSVPAVYQLIETADNDYRTRTKLNVENADITILFTYAGGMDRGTLFTRNHADSAKKFWAHICFGVLRPWESDVKHARWLREKLTTLSTKLGRPLIVNIAGNRESRSPGIEKRTRELLCLALNEDDLKGAEEWLNVVEEKD